MDTANNTATSTRTSSKLTALESLIESRYDVNPLRCDGNVISWAADILAEKIGYQAVWAQVSKLNRHREKAGRYPFYPQYGTALFGAWSGLYQGSR